MGAGRGASLAVLQPVGGRHRARPRVFLRAGGQPGPRPRMDRPPGFRTGPRRHGRHALRRNRARRPTRRGGARGPCDRSALSREAGLLGSRAVGRSGHRAPPSRARSVGRGDRSGARLLRCRASSWRSPAAPSRPGRARARPGLLPRLGALREDSMTLLIRGGEVVTATDRYVADVLVDGETVAQIGTRLDVKADRTIDATGLYVLPGGIDVHTHMDLPFGGTFSSDDFETGTMAAAHGGTTTIIDFAVQGMGEPLQVAYEAWRGKAEGKVAIDYALHMIVRDLPEVRLADMD